MDADSSRNDRVVITGTGLVCSLGTTIQEVWNAVISGRSGVRQIEGFNAQGFQCSVAAQVQGLDSESLGFEPRDSRIMDVHSLMLMKSVRDALSHAAIDNSAVPREKLALFAGMGMVDYRIDDLLPAVVKSGSAGKLFDYRSFYGEGYKEIHPLWPLSMLNNISFCQVAIALDIQGENTVFSPDADSGSCAVAEAMWSLQEGSAVAALAAGVSETISPFSLARAQLSGMLPSGAAPGDGNVRPFYNEQNGTVLGEGCGVLVMELHSAAEKRGVPPLAVLSGCGRSFGKEDGAGAPTVRAISAAMEKAISSAEIGPCDIDLIIAHADGMAAGDMNEIKALQQVFGDCGRDLPVLCSKAVLGQTRAAAPVIDLVLAVSMLREGTIPVILRADRSNSGVMDMPVRRILVNARSCEGQAVSLVLEEAGA